jgi:hypothetical protein
MNPQPASRLPLHDPPPEAPAGAALEYATAPERPVRRGWRRYFTWSSTSAPVGLLLLTGIALGGQGINLLTPAALSLLEPVVPVALAALGVLAGLGAGDRRRAGTRVFAAACLTSAVTIVIVSGGIAMVAFLAMPSLASPLRTLILASGICAATSLTLPTGSRLEPRPAATRVIELGALLPIVAGGLVLAWLRTGSATAAVTLLAQASVITWALASAGWLLLTRASSETEERVFAVSVLLLVGGVADALSLSALFGGLVAGLFWWYAGGHPRDTISRDVLFVQHPLLVLVLLVAGARADLSGASLALGAAYLVLRVAGLLVGSTVARGASGVKVPRDLGLRLLPPGVFGVAFALNAVSVVGVDPSILLGAVVAGTIGSEFVALLVSGRRAGE